MKEQPVQTAFSQANDFPQYDAVVIKGHSKLSHSTDYAKLYSV
jgi:hypothetical protein